jgi:hypothetical protein
VSIQGLEAAPPKPEPPKAPPAPPKPGTRPNSPSPDVSEEENHKRGELAGAEDAKYDIRLGLTEPREMFVIRKTAPPEMVVAGKPWLEGYSDGYDKVWNKHAATASKRYPYSVGLPEDASNEAGPLFVPCGKWWTHPGGALTYGTPARSISCFWNSARRRLPRLRRLTGKRTARLPLRMNSIFLSLFYTQTMRFGR